MSLTNIMNLDLSTWLKDELGLMHASESDLNSLMFHPRHGSLCRRLIKFLSDSTLCQQKYPNIYAEEKYAEATDELEKTRELRLKVLQDLDHCAKDNENDERDLAFLQSKLENLKILNELQQVSMAALKEMENRNNLGIDHIAYQIETCDYLSNHSLESLYLVPDLNKVTSFVSPRQMTTIDDDLKDILTKVETMHHNINESLTAIDDRMDEMADQEPHLRKISIQDLIALKKPEFEEVSVYVGAEEKKVYDANIELIEEVELMEQQVADLSRLHKEKRDDMNIGFKNELDKYMAIVRNLQAIKNVIL